MAFIPSKYSHYGQAEVVEEGGALPSEEILTAVRTFFFGEEAREQAALLEAKIENLQQLAATTAGPLRNFYLNEINKLQARLEAVREEAAEAEYAAQTTAVTRTAVAIATVLGVLVVGGIALNQFQQLRIRQEELRRLRGA